MNQIVGIVAFVILFSMAACGGMESQPTAPIVSDPSSTPTTTPTSSPVPIATPSPSPALIATPPPTPSPTPKSTVKQEVLPFLRDPASAQKQLDNYLAFLDVMFSDEAVRYVNGLAPECRVLTKELIRLEARAADILTRYLESGRNEQDLLTADDAMRSNLTTNPTLRADMEEVCPTELTATPSPIPTPIPTPSPTPTATPIPSPTPTPTPTIIPKTSEPYELMLDLINEARVASGVQPVVMGDNRAAQIHADNSLAHCISSHWSIDGLTPNMRYSLAGAYQSEKEIASGTDFCKRPFQGYTPILDLSDEVRDAMKVLMQSEGHREDILRPRHRKVNIGLAWDLFNFVAYQQFEGDYVEYTVLPTIEDGVLSLDGSTNNGASIVSSGYSPVIVYYSPPPQELTQGQIARTYSICWGRKVAHLSYKSEGAVETTWISCSTPYDISPELPGPSDRWESRELYEEARQRYRETLQRVAITSRRIKMHEYELEGDRFSIRADLSDVLAEHGPGVYEVVLWGILNGELEPISEYSIFHNIPRPTGYEAAN